MKIIILSICILMCGCLGRSHLNDSDSNLLHTKYTTSFTDIGVAYESKETLDKVKEALHWFNLYNEREDAPVTVESKEYLNFVIPVLNTSVQQDDGNIIITYDEAIRFYDLMFTSMQSKIKKNMASDSFLFSIEGE